MNVSRVRPRTVLPGQEARIVQAVHVEDPKHLRRDGQSDGQLIGFEPRAPARSSRHPADRHLGKVKGARA